MTEAAKPDEKSKTNVQKLTEFVIDNPQLNELEQRIADFNIFEALGAVRQELRHSDFLAFLLNPAGKHGLGDRLLKRFLIRVISGAVNPPFTALDIDLANLAKATVGREDLRVDILIRDEGSGLTCIIENKIDSDEHSDQLNRYLEAVAENLKINKDRIIAVYLTPDGIRPADEDSPFTPLSYKDIAELIEQVRSGHESALGADVNTMMRHYVMMLERHIMSDTDIEKLCHQIYAAHKDAIDLIIEHRPDMQRQIAKYLAEKIKSESSLELFREAKTYIDFRPKGWKEIVELNVGNGWAGSQAILSFEFSTYGNKINLYLELGPVKAGFEDVRRKIYDSLKLPNQNKYSLQWTRFKKMGIKPISYKEVTSMDELTDKIDKLWQHFVEYDLERIDQEVRQIFAEQREG